MSSVCLNKNTIQFDKVVLKWQFDDISCGLNKCLCGNTTPPHHNRLRPFFWDHPGELVPEENFWTLWCKGRLTEADTPTIRLGATPSGLTTAHLHHPLNNVEIMV